MLIYLLSIAFYIFVLIKGVGEKGLISKLLIASAIALSGYNLYRIFAGEISDTFIINLLLAIIPGVVFLVGIVLLFNDNSENNKNTKPQNNTSYFNVNITDNEITQSATHPQSVQLPTNEPKNNIQYCNAKIDGYGMCDVTETQDYTKITMKADGKIYDFYVQGPNIVAYSTDKTTKIQNY